MTGSEAALVGRWLAARRAGDYDAALAMMTDDVVWDSPVAGEQRGRAAVKVMLVAAEEETASFDSRPIELRSHGTVVGALVRNRVRRGGDSLDSTQLLLFTVARDAISHVRIVVDDPEQVREFWSAD